MSAHRTSYLVCDNCGEVFDIAERRLYITRTEALAAGWSRSGDRDWCAKEACQQAAKLEV